MNHTKDLFTKTHFFILVMIGFLSLVITPSAQACGGFFSQDKALKQNQLNILFAADGVNVEAHIKTHYKGQAKDFSWIGVAPTKPELSVGENKLFDILDIYTYPTYSTKETIKGECRSPSKGAESASAKGANILKKSTVGPYESVISQPQNSQAIAKWLSDNQYKVPANFNALIKPYLEKKMYFIALKLKAGENTSSLQPIVLKFKAKHPGIPLRFMAESSAQNMGLNVWILGQSRAFVQNYHQLQVNPAYFDWYKKAPHPLLAKRYYNGTFDIENPDSYEHQLYNLVMDKVLVQQDGNYVSQDNQALSDEYAYPDAVSPGQPDNYTAVLESALSENKQPAFVTEYAGKSDIIIPPLTALLKDKPEVLAPLENLFKKYSYLTRLHTILTPTLTSKDPMFNFSKMLPEVPRNHSLKTTVLCSPTTTEKYAPRVIQFNDDLSVPVTSSYHKDDKVAEDISYILKLEQLYQERASNTILNNQRKLKKRLKGYINQKLFLSLNPTHKQDIQYQLDLHSEKQSSLSNNQALFIFIIIVVVGIILIIFRFIKARD